MERMCSRKCWNFPARKKMNVDPELECLECILMDHIEGYPSKDYELVGKLKIERGDLGGVDD